MKLGFDSEKYLEEQSQAILERAGKFDDKLYLEFGGKLICDFHAARILPGFDPNAKIKLLQKLKDKVDIVICIYAGDIEQKKMRADFGLSYDTDTMRTIDDLRDWGLDVNLRGAIYCCRAILGGMMERRRGVIINFGSVTGEQGGGGPSLDYSAEKSAMKGMTKSLAILGAPYNVRACCVIPGPVLTRPGMANMKTLLGRAAEPVELVDFILYLCSDKAAFITGSSHVIDGGRLLLQP